MPPEDADFARRAFEPLGAPAADLLDAARRCRRLDWAGWGYPGLDGEAQVGPSPPPGHASAMWSAAPPSALARGALRPAPGRDQRARHSRRNRAAAPSACRPHSPRPVSCPASPSPASVMAGRLFFEQLSSTSPFSRPVIASRSAVPFIRPSFPQTQIYRAGCGALTARSSPAPVCPSTTRIEHDRSRAAVR